MLFTTRISLESGAEDWKVGEHLSGVRRVVMVVEVEDWVEPTALFPSELAALIRRFGSSTGAGRAIGASEAFIRQNAEMASFPHQEKQD